MEIRSHSTGTERNLGAATVTFHAFIAGGCHMSGVGTVAN
jgi:hypothetical protein